MKSHMKMRDIKGVWTLCSSVLFLNFLNAEKQRTADKRPGIERGAVEIKWPTYLMNILALKTSKAMFAT